MSYKLTAAGGIPIRRGSLDTIALEIIGQHDGLRFVRDINHPTGVMELDVERARWFFTESCSVIPLVDAPDWCVALWRILRAGLPHLNPTVPPTEETGHGVTPEQGSAGG